MPVSKRALKSLSLSCAFFDAFEQTFDKMYHPQLNPDGALNLGIARNDLLHQKVYEKAKSCLELAPNDLNYGAPEGSQEIRQHMQEFFTRHFKPYYPIKWTDIFMQNGAGASINQLFMSIADPGEYCMVPTPFYGAFQYDVSVHTGLHLLPVYLHGNNLQDMYIDSEQLEAYYQQAKSEGKNITTMLITNPENPLGRCYPKKDIETILSFAAHHNVHVVFDEIYALSTYSQMLDDKTDPFVSVLSLPYKDIIDPTLIHVIYGLSKDFAVNGFRVGYIVTQFNETLKKALGRSAPFSYVSTITDRLLCNIFSDRQWIDEYLLENRQALAVSYTKTTEFLKSHGISYIAGQAGPFLLIDVRSKLLSVTSESAELQWHKMIDGGVYLALGSVFYLNEPGYFRLTFALPWDILQTGLMKLVNALN